MNLLKEMQSMFESANKTVKQSFESKECNEYEIFDSNNVKICYVVEYFYSPIDNEKLDHTVYEFYTVNLNETSNYEDDDFIESYVYDDVEFLLKDLENFAV
jgi:hypothetical protein